MQMYNNILYTISENNCQIQSGYKITDRETMTDFCSFVLTSGNFAKRSVGSYVAEWRAHNLLYKLGLFRAHTQDVDLNVNESKIRRFFYYILSFFYF